MTEPPEQRVRRVLGLSARELREQGELWPEHLTDEELQAELEALQQSPVHQPIAYRMLRRECERRGLP